MTGPDDVIAALNTRVVGDASVSDVLPGPIAFERSVEDTAAVYAVSTLEPGDRIETSGAFIQEAAYVLSVTIPAKLTTLPALERAIIDRMTWKTGQTVLSGGGVLVSIRMTGTPVQTIDTNLKNTDDMFRIVFRWNVTYAGVLTYIS